MEVSLPLILSAAALDSFNPCAISLLLIYIGMMFSMQKSHKTILQFGFFYISAIFLTYFLIGMGLLRVFHFFGIPNVILYIAGGISILFGLLNIKEYFWPNSPLSIRMPMGVRQAAMDWAHKATIPSAIVLGVLVGISEFPCSGAVYLGVLGYLQAKESFTTGVLYLLLYNLVFVSPLIAIYVVATNRLITERMINWQEQFGRKMHLLLAGLMIALGFFVIWPYKFIIFIKNPFVWIALIVIMALNLSKNRE